MPSVKVLNKFISPAGRDYSYMSILLPFDKIYWVTRDIAFNVPYSGSGPSKDTFLWNLLADPGQLGLRWTWSFKQNKLVFASLDKTHQILCGEKQCHRLFQQPHISLKLGQMSLLQHWSLKVADTILYIKSSLYKMGITPHFITYNTHI